MKIDQTRILLCLCLFTGCGPAVGMDIADGTTTEEPSSSGPPSSTTPSPTSQATSASPSTTSADTLPPGTTTSPPDPSTGALTETGTDGGTETEETDGGMFLIDPDHPVAGFECDAFEQDCPRGEKCMPWANDGGNAWNGLRCSPIDLDPDAVGEPCTVEGSAVSGIDSCELGAMCWDVGRDGIGECTPLCTGSINEPICPQESFCTIASEGVLTLCLPTCNPLEADACDEGDGCYPHFSGTFTCIPDASGSGGGVAEACEFINACDPGFLCAGPFEDFCEGPGDSCCTPYCDLDDPQCPASLTCTPFFEDVVPGYENLGVCF